MTSFAYDLEQRTVGSDGHDDTESGEDGHGGTDNDLHCVVWGVVWCPGTMGAESDKVGCGISITRSCSRGHVAL